MAKNKMPTVEEIESRKSDFLSELETIHKKEKEDKGSPKRNFLSSISTHIKDALDKDTSYVGIKTAIKKVYHVDVSTQMISSFAHNELGIAKRKKPSSNLKEKTKGSQTSMEIKQEIANKAQKEDSL